MPTLRIHGNNPKFILGSSDSDALSIDGKNGFNVSQGGQKLLELTNDLEASTLEGSSGPDNTSDTDVVYNILLPPLAESLAADYQRKLLLAGATLPKIKSSSLSYLNAAQRIGFDYQSYFNDFTNEGHMYPVHGVGDLDRTEELMGKFISSVQGESFDITDLGIKIKVVDERLKTPNAFFDFHNIPTKMLDGSTKLPNGKRVEDHITYFNPKAEDDVGTENLMELDWISGNARFMNSSNVFNYDVSKEFPTSLASTRATPFLNQDEWLGLVFFMDGPQARVNNGGKVSNWRYVVPMNNVDIAWFVAKAYVPCGPGQGKQITTSDGKTLRVRPRTANETDDLTQIAYNQNRYMETVSKSVIISSSQHKSQAFNQRYTEKVLDFGELMMRKVPDGGINLPTLGVSNDTSGTSQNWDSLFSSFDADLMSIFNMWVTNANDQDKDYQIAFNEMLHMIKDKIDELKVPCPGRNSYLRDETETALDKFPVAHKLYKFFKDKYLREDTYNISVAALNTKARNPKSYIPTPVGETGWLVVESCCELEVPNEPGEFFIGWSILNQPTCTDVTNVCDTRQRRWVESHGYTLHQGPGVIFLTGGDFPHAGTQEPYLLEHNYPPQQIQADSTTHQRLRETDNEYNARVLAQLPQVHWRLDRQEIVLKALEKGVYTEANVGAGQKMLASIGTKTLLTAESRSPNFLGKAYQQLLANKSAIQDLVGREPVGNEVYEVVSVDNENLFIYGQQQSGYTSTSY